MKNKLIGGYGWNPERPSQEVTPFKTTLHRESSLPTEVDLRASMPAIYDQKQLGSCVSNGVAALVEHRMIVSKYKFNFMPARLFIYYNCRANDGTINQDAGTDISTGIAMVNKFGVPPEYMWPYSDNTTDIPFVKKAPFRQKPTDKCYQDALLHKSLKDMSVNLDRATVLNTIAQGRPVSFGFSVYESFESDYTMQTGIMTVPQPGENQVGGHCVDVVGYILGQTMGPESIQDWVIIRNSWGPNIYGKWAGHFLMPLDDVLCCPAFASDAHTIDLLVTDSH